MAIIVHNKRHLFFLILILFFSSCSREGDVGDVVVEENTMSNYIEDDPAFSTLHLALERTGLKGNISGSEKTFLAPNDAAFNNYLLQSEYDNIYDVPVEKLRKLLLNHILENEYTFFGFSTGYYNTMAMATSSGRNLSLYAKVGEEISFNGTAKISRENLAVENGTVHEIDAVLEIATISDFLTIDEDLEIAGTSFKLEESFNYAEAFKQTSSPAPYTVFVPSNASFASFLEEYNIASIEEIPSSTITAILSYHVTAQNNLNSEDFKEHPALETMQGSLININSDDGIKIIDVNGRTANCIGTNIQADNGIIHVVDKLLVPNID